MATKKTTTAIPRKTAPAKTAHQSPSAPKSKVSVGGGVLNENRNKTTVFQTRPTPPDPTKK